MNSKPAISAYEKALEMEPHAVLAMVNQAMAYARMGDTQNAHEALSNAYENQPLTAPWSISTSPLSKAQANDP
jgi:predicted Zn-dependent protease